MSSSYQARVMKLPLVKVDEKFRDNVLLMEKESTLPVRITPSNKDEMIEELKKSLAQISR